MPGFAQMVKQTLSWGPASLPRGLSQVAFKPPFKTSKQTEEISAPFPTLGLEKDMHGLRRQRRRDPLGERWRQPVLRNQSIRLRRTTSGATQVRTTGPGVAVLSPGDRGQRAPLPWAGVRTVDELSPQWLPAEEATVTPET